MATKTITVTEDAYQSIKKLKYEEESFSDLFKRIGRDKMFIRNYFGILKKSEKELEKERKRIREIREKLSRDMEKREKNVRSG